MSDPQDITDTVAAIMAALRLGIDVRLCYGYPYHERFFLLFDKNSVIVTDNCAEYLVTYREGISIDHLSWLRVSPKAFQRYVQLPNPPGRLEDVVLMGGLMELVSDKRRSVRQCPTHPNPTKT